MLVIRIIPTSLSCCRAGQPRRVGEEAHLPHRDQRLPSVLCCGVEDQAGVEPHGARWRHAVQQHCDHGPGLVPSGSSHQEDPRWPAGTAGRLQSADFAVYIYKKNAVHELLIYSYLTHFWWNI